MIREITIKFQSNKKIRINSSKWNMSNFTSHKILSELVKKYKVSYFLLDIYFKISAFRPSSNFIF